MPSQLHLLHLSHYPILKQLQLEERLLRHDHRNWCLINEGSSPAIVMGISGKVEELIDQKKAQEAKIPLIKRFSGGGTVVVDENTLFVTFIFQKEAHPFPCYPEPIMRWSETLYLPLFPPGLFSLRENDYVIGERKCGGNAQYIRKERWLHHTSFLWDFSPEKMACLLYPKKTPQYRAARSHADFLCRLSDHFPSKDAFITAFIRVLKERYHVQTLTLAQASSTSISSEEVIPKLRNTTSLVPF